MIERASATRLHRRKPPEADYGFVRSLRFLRLKIDFKLFEHGVYPPTHTPSKEIQRLARKHDLARRRCWGSVIRQIDAYPSTVIERDLWRILRSSLSFNRWTVSTRSRKRRKGNHRRIGDVLKCALLRMKQHICMHIYVICKYTHARLCARKARDNEIPRVLVCSSNDDLTSRS